LIELNGISRDYHVGDTTVHALREVDLGIAEGEYVSIMGPSGSGKSTLLNILGCLDRPTAGSYRLDGQNVDGLSEVELARVRRETIGFVFQSYHLVPRLDATQNVALPLLFAGVEESERRARAAKALSAVHLEERAHHRPDQLSGGQRQRVAIARAIIMEPRVLLADEPTGNLDTKSGNEIVELLEQLNASALTLIVVTHDHDVAKRARRHVHMVDGQIEQDVQAAAES